MPLSDDVLVDRLRDAGLRVTKPKLATLAVLEEARARHEHLPVAAVAERVRERIGTLSAQGAYDCLDALVESGLARRIEPAGQPTLYEARVRDNHHHLVCRGCGLVTDVDCTVGDALCLTPSATNGFVLDEAEVTFWGRCPSCAGSTEA
ncbi:Fur family transcriptional regulator [Herbiconiux sp. SYSU D00978]|uniref:Fur family transcriptional regulator n=1 Tax=Herbiconiux sp. SYSU D00978 TaxID=2812562 RepID=UPI001A961198|nr:Fur family transcriptional regulator [Herbiconiux sp. SYSU D00978]